MKLCDNRLISKYKYFDFNALSKRFQKILLDLLEKEIGPSFKSEKKIVTKTIKMDFMFMQKRKNLKI